MKAHFSRVRKKSAGFPMTGSQLTIANTLALEEFRKPVHHRIKPHKIFQLAKRISKIGCK